MSVTPEQNLDFTYTLRRTPSASMCPTQTSGPSNCVWKELWRCFLFAHFWFLTKVVIDFVVFRHDYRVSQFLSPLNLFRQCPLTGTRRGLVMKTPSPTNWILIALTPMDWTRVRRDRKWTPPTQKLFNQPLKINWELHLEDPLDYQLFGLYWRNPDLCPSLGLLLGRPTLAFAGKLVSVSLPI